MDNNTRLMSIVFNLDEPLLIREYPSDIVLFNTFSTIQTNTPIWTPSSDKIIFLTAVQATAPLPISIILSDGEDNFLSLRTTEPFSTVSQRFLSPFKLNMNNTLMVSTSDEEIPCNVFGSISAIQVNYNGRGDFNNVNNAVGLANGSVASLSSGLLVQSRGRIVLGYNMSISEHDYLEIEKVVIKYYCRLSLTVAVGVSSMILFWRPNPQTDWIELQQISLALIGTINNLTIPITHDITETVLG